VPELAGMGWNVMGQSDGTPALEVVLSAHVAVFADLKAW